MNDAGAPAMSAAPEGTAGDVAALAKMALREPFSRRSWAELAYAVAGFPLALVGFVLAVVTLGLLPPPVVSVTVPLLAVPVVVMRYLGSVNRALARRLLGLAVEAPAPFRASRGWTGRARSALTDRPAWRARAFLLADFPIALASFVAAVALRAGSVFFVISPLEWVAGLGAREVVTDGVAHRYVVHFGSFYFDSWPRMALAVAVGIFGWWLAPWALRPLISADKALVAGLLGPFSASARVEHLEKSRAQVVESSEALLRRLERDLHDGAQAELVAISMKLGLAREKLAGAAAAGQPGGPGTDLAQAAKLVDAAQEGTREAIGQLRDLARGIHPPGLDQGLGVALGTLAAKSTVPLELSVELPARPSSSLEAALYFCAAELLTNVAKHSGASWARLELGGAGTGLTMRVSDNGGGGAQVGPDGGLSGLVTRLEGVDGTLEVSSPAGGPTVATVRVPVVP